MKVQRDFDHAYHCLQDLHRITACVNKMLAEDDWDKVIIKLNERERLLQQLQKHDLSDIYKVKDDKFVNQIKATVKSIKVLDEENSIVMKSKLDNSSKALRDLPKQKQAAHNLRSVSKSRTKQLFNLVQ